MRIGAIFARGSCRALKWMALFGVVFALGAGSALAQATTIAVKSVTVLEKAAGNKVEEGALVTVQVTLDKRVPRSTTTGTPSTVTVTLTDGVPSGALNDVGNAEDGTVTEDNIDDVVIPNGVIVIGEQQSSGTANVLLGRDLDAVNEKFRLTAIVTAVTGTTGDPGVAIVGNTTDGKNFDGTIVDAQEQKYELKATTPARNIKEGSTIDLTLRADPERPIGEDVDIFMQLSDSDNFSINAGTVATQAANQRTLSNTTASHDVEIVAGGNDKNRTDDMLTIRLVTGQVGRSLDREAVALTVLDIHKLPDADAIEAEARDNKKYADGMMITSVAEGGMAYVWVEVTNTTRDAVSDDEEFTVSLAAADQNQLLDYRVSPSSYKTESRGGFTSSGDDTEMVGPFTLEALSDEDIGDEELMLYVNLTGQSTTYGAGESNGMFSITIEDSTKPMVWAKSDDDIEAAVYAAKGEGPMYPGDSFEVMTSDLFMMAEGVTVAYSATSDSDAASASASASMVKVTAEEAGMAHITITGTASMSGAKALPQTMSNIAQVIFPVEVMERPMTYMLSGPDDMNIVEGGMGAMITVTANQAVAMDTEVMVMRDRAMSSAGDDDYTLDPMMITIMEGEMMGSAMVMAVEDDMMESMNNMPEELVLFAMAGDMEVEGTVKLYVWDAAVPALPVIAQLLLAAFLAIGGYRRYLRR